MGNIIETTKAFCVYLTYNNKYLETKKSKFTSFVKSYKMEKLGALLWGEGKFKNLLP